MRISDIYRFIDRVSRKLRPDVASEYRLLMAWYMADHYEEHERKRAIEKRIGRKKKGSGGRPPDAHISTIAYAFFQFNKRRRKTVKYQYYQIDEFVADTMQAKENSYYRLSELKDEEARVKKINVKLERYLKTDDGSRAIYILSKIELAGPEGFKATFGVRSHHDIPIREIRASIRKQNMEAFSYLKSWDIGQKGSISTDIISPDTMVAESLGKKYRGSGYSHKNYPFDEKPIAIFKKQNIRTILELRDNTRLIMLGEPGIGKSVTLKGFTYCNSSRRVDEVPIYIDLRYHGIVSGIWEYIKDFFPFDLTNDIKAHLCERILKHGNFLIILDGYNEVRLRIGALNIEISRFAESHSLNNNRFILSSRMYNYPRGFDSFNTCKLEPLDKTGMLKLLRKLRIKNPQKLLKELDTKGFYALSVIPIFLNYIASFYQDKESLRGLLKERGQLLRLIIRKHFEGMENKFFSDEAAGINMDELIEAVFPSIAYNTIGTFGGNQFSLQDLRKLVVSSGINYDSHLVLDASRRHGLIEVFHGRCSFWHQLFQDYFAAIEICNRLKVSDSDSWPDDDRVRYLNYLIHNDNYLESLILMTELHKPELIIRILYAIEQLQDDSFTLWFLPSLPYFGDESEIDIAMDCIIKTIASRSFRI